ncbi:unnamed protein product [marine sediment metagenome]|uniref:Uncharacterized protein n=1 Tax=marine sediment metagenome TaxID=412755 RepID=X1TJ96_9ZZZZ
MSSTAFTSLSIPKPIKVKQPAINIAGMPKSINMSLITSFLPQSLKD